MGVILHLSDLHFGKDHGFRIPGSPIQSGVEQDLAEVIVDDLCIQKIDRVDGIIVSGDIITYGEWLHYKRNALDTLIKLRELLGVDADRFISFQVIMITSGMRRKLILNFGRR